MLQSFTLHQDDNRFSFKNDEIKKKWLNEDRLIEIQTYFEFPKIGVQCK
jgi:hypothetical protein